MRSADRNPVGSIHNSPKLHKLGGCSIFTPEEYERTHAHTHARSYARTFRLLANRTWNQHLPPRIYVSPTLFHVIHSLRIFCHFFLSPFSPNLAQFLSEGVKRRSRAANRLPSLEPFVLFMGKMTLIEAFCIGLSSVTRPLLHPGDPLTGPHCRRLIKGSHLWPPPGWS